MKRKTLNRILSFLVIATLFVVACTKEKSDVRLPQKLATTQVLNIKSDSALVVGYVLAEGDGFTERGICYNTAAAPTIANNKIVYTGQLTTAAFKVKLEALNMPLSIMQGLMPLVPMVLFTAMSIHSPHCLLHHF